MRWCPEWWKVCGLEVVREKGSKQAMKTRTEFPYSVSILSFCSTLIKPQNGVYTVYIGKGHNSEVLGHNWWLFRSPWWVSEKGRERWVREKREDH